MIGKIKWYDSKRGFGFIADENKNDIFFHITRFVMDEPQTIIPGVDVNFDIRQTPKGKEAVNIRIGGNQ